MKRYEIFTAVLAFAGLTLTSAESAVAQEGGASSITQCASQLEECVLTTPLATSFICPAEFQACAASVAVAVSQTVVSAISDAVECQRAELGCAAEATTPPKLALCTEDQAQCVASIVGIELPGVVEGTTECVDSATDCILQATVPGDLASCGEQMRGCALDQVKTVVPEAVGQVIDDIEKCRSDLGLCIGDADSPSKVTECNEYRLECVADVFGVQLPELHGSDFVRCGEQAQACGLDVSSPQEVAACGRTLRSCVADVAGEIVDQQLTCEQKWTACMRQNPSLAGFYVCAAETAGCTD